MVMVVSMPLCCCASCAKKFALRGLMVGVSAKKFALRGLMVGVSAKKFALHAQNTPQSAFLRLLGEFFRANRPCARSCRRRGALQAGCGGGFAALEAGWLCVVGVSYL